MDESVSSLSVSYVITEESKDRDSQSEKTRLRLADLEKQLLAATSDLSGHQAELKALKSRNSELEATLERTRAALEEQREESTELISKVTAQSAEKVKLQNANVELQSKLSMAELLTQQVTA